MTMEKPEGYPEIIFQDNQTVAPTNINNNPVGESSGLWQGEKNDMSFEFGDHDYYYSFGDSGKSEKVLLSNTKLMALIEFLRELFLRRKELLPHLQSQIIETVKKKGIRFWRVESGNARTRVATMTRSLSLGSPRRNEWIKITTIKITGVSGGDSSAGSGGQGSGGASKS